MDTDVDIASSPLDVGNATGETETPTVEHAEDGAAPTAFDTMKQRFTWAPAVALARCVETASSRSDESRYVTTLVTFEVTEVLLGELPAGERRTQVVVSGGSFEGARSHAADAGEYERGKTYLLMYSKGRDGRAVLLGDDASAAAVSEAGDAIRYLDVEYTMADVLEQVGKAIDLRAIPAPAVAPVAIGGGR